MNTNKSNKKVSGIYKIINKVNEKYYIGSSDNILGKSGRWSEHINSLRANTHDNSYLQRSWNKYGENNFDFVIIEYVSKENLLLIEQHHLDNAKKDGKKCYNLSPFAIGGGFFGHRHTQKSKLQASKKLKGRISPNKDKKHPELSGEKNPRCNHTIFTFRNIYTQEIFTGKRCNFVKKYNLNNPPIKNLTQKKSKVSQGWTIE